MLFSAGKLQEPEYHVKGEFWNEENENNRNEIMSGWQRKNSSFFIFLFLILTGIMVNRRYKIKKEVKFGAWKWNLFTPFWSFHSFTSFLPVLRLILISIKKKYLRTESYIMPVSRWMAMTAWLYSLIASACFIRTSMVSSMAFTYSTYEISPFSYSIALNFEICAEWAWLFCS